VRSGPSNQDRETAAVVAHDLIVDAQEKCSGLFHDEGFARANKDKPVRQDPNFALVEALALAIAPPTKARS